MHELLVQWLAYVVPWIEFLGIAVVLWGVLEASSGLARRGWAVLTRQAARIEELVAIRFAMGEKMVLGLEFFLAGDIVQTIMAPSWNSLAILGGIVVIRSVIVYFLNLELSRGLKQGNACPVSSSSALTSEIAFVERRPDQSGGSRDAEK